MSKADKSVRKGTRRLLLPKELNEEFSSIRNFGNFEKYAMSKYYHYFYSIAVAYSANETSKNPKPKSDLENLKKLPSRDVPSIDNPQLAHHDDFFKTIAYWYKMKLGEEEYYKILTEPDKSREIAEMFFLSYWVYFKGRIENFSSDFPDVQMVELIEDKLRNIKNESE